MPRPSSATLRWVDWFNNRRLLEPIGHVPPAEYKALTMSQPDWPDSHQRPSDFPGPIH